jgi:hypothetical protein
MISAGISRCWSRAASLSCCDCRDVAGQDDLTAAKLIAAIAHFALDFACKESVCGDHGH